MSIATVANWLPNFVVTVSFLRLLSAIGGTGAFLMFGFMSLLAIVYFVKRVPETKNRPLAEIERELVNS